MKIKLMLCLITVPLLGIDPPLPDVVRVELEGLKDFPREVNITHKIEVPSSAATRLTGLGLSLLGGVTIIVAVWDFDTYVKIKEAIKPGIALIGTGIGLLKIDDLINEWNKQGTTDETTKEENQLPDDHNVSELLADNLSS